MKVVTTTIPSQDKRPSTRILYAREGIRVVSFCVDAGQSIPSHVNTGSVSLLVLEGRGKFCGENDSIAELGPGEMVTYEPNESHGISCDEGMLRFVAFIAAV
jgi:quercetin dioxygenase-like cupin family protein